MGMRMMEMMTRTLKMETNDACVSYCVDVNGQNHLLFLWVNL